MGSRNWGDDDRLMRDLVEALRPSPIERQVIEAARAAYAWRRSDADAELAALRYDSVLDGAAGVRDASSGRSPRTLYFGQGGPGVELEVSEDGIEGQLIPPAPGRVRLVSVSGGLIDERAADEVGCFAFPAQRSDAVRLECSTVAGTFVTQWIVP